MAVKKELLVIAPTKEQLMKLTNFGTAKQRALVNGMFVAGKPTPDPPHLLDGLFPCGCLLQVNLRPILPCHFSTTPSLNMSLKSSSLEADLSSG